jgi:hypothetical protein
VEAALAQLVLRARVLPVQLVLRAMDHLEVQALREHQAILALLELLGLRVQPGHQQECWVGFFLRAMYRSI